MCDWDAEDVKYYEGHVCVVCSTFEPNQWLPDVAQSMASLRLCKTCHFWAQNRQNGTDQVVIDGDWGHYRIGDDNIINASFSGFGGREWCVFWSDKSRRTTVTRNLWSQGIIPEYLRENFVRNATLISTDEILKKAHFVELLNL